MNNYELNKRAEELTDTNTAYELARRLLGLQEALREQQVQLVEQADHAARIVAAGQELERAFKQVLPGIKYIALQDYAVINDAPRDWHKAVSGLTAWNRKRLGLEDDDG